MIQKLIENIKKTNAPIVVGLDPMLSYIPEQVKAAAFKEYGETLEGAAEAVWQYNKAIVDEVYDLIPAVKPQIEMYEQFGIPGLTAFKRTLYLRSLCDSTSWSGADRCSDGNSVRRGLCDRESIPRLGWHQAVSRGVQG